MKTIEEINEQIHGKCFEIWQHFRISKNAAWTARKQLEILYWVKGEEIPSMNEIMKIGTKEYHRRAHVSTS